MRYISQIMFGIVLQKNTAKCQKTQRRKKTNIICLKALRIVS